MNMSYCRFNNTNIDLQDCIGALEDGETLSKAEFNCCKNLFRTFLDFCLDEGIIEDENYELDERLEEFYKTIDVER